MLTGIVRTKCRGKLELVTPNPLHPIDPFFVRGGFFLPFAVFTIFPNILNVQELIFSFKVSLFVFGCTPYSMNSLFGEFFKDFWPDFWPRFLARFLSRFLAGVLTRVFGPPKYSVQYYWDGEIQCTVLLGQRKHTIYYLLFEIQKIQNSILGTLKYYLK